MSNVVSIFPAPPPELMAAEAEQWRVLVACRPRSWWTNERIVALAEYCRVIVRANFISREIERCQPESDQDRYLSLLDIKCGLTEQMVAAYDRAFG